MVARARASRSSRAVASGRGGEPRPDRLDGNTAGQHFVLGKEDLPHASFAEEVEHPIAGNGRKGDRHDRPLRSDLLGCDVGLARDEQLPLPASEIHPEDGVGPVREEVARRAGPTRPGRDRFLRRNLHPPRAKAHREYGAPPPSSGRGRGSWARARRTISWPRSRRSPSPPQGPHVQTPRWSWPRAPRPPGRRDAGC